MTLWLTLTGLDELIHQRGGRQLMPPAVEIQEMITAYTKSGIVRPEKDSLEQLIRSRLGTSVNQLQVQLSDQGIVLMGKTQSWYMKQLVQELVMEHCSMPIAMNDIRVILQERN